MNVLLINPISRDDYGKNLRFPLSLAYISNALMKNHRVEILDLAVKKWNLTQLEELLPEYSHINVIGLTGLITEYENIKNISKLFKKYYPDKPIILGGAFATSMPCEIIERTPVDIIVAGEGELTVKELFDKLSNKEDISTVSGICFKKDGKFISTGPREYITDLDSIDIPSRKGFNIEHYFRNSPLVMFGSRKTLNMITSRGCPYNCFYCDKGTWGNRCRVRSPENIVKEVEYLIDTFGVDSIVFHDDTFNINNERLLEFCDLLIDKNIRINWSSNCRVNNMTLEIAKKMRRAGCRMIAYGIESGNQDILDSMKKGVKLPQVSRAIRATRQAGIIPFAYLMIGWFDETREQVMDTIRFCMDNRLIGDFSFFTPVPHTPAFFKVQEERKLLDADAVLSNWGKWHLQKMVNVSSMTDNELINLKRQAERKILWDNLTNNIFLYIKALGIFSFLREIARRIIRYGIKGIRVRCE